MPFIPSHSAAGALHPSKTEASAANRFKPLGIIPHDSDLPVPFKDADGVMCEGRSDFFDPVFGILIETKASHLNGKKTKANSAKALERLEDSIRAGHVTRDSQAHRFKILDSGWNHSIHQLAAKTKACHSAGFPYLVVFTEKPDKATVDRLDRINRKKGDSGVLWVQVGDDDFKQLMAYRKFASIPGITVTAVPIKEWQIRP